VLGALEPCFELLACWESAREWRAPAGEFEPPQAHSSADNAATISSFNPSGIELFLAPL